MSDTVSPPRHILWYRFTAFLLRNTAVPIAKKKLDIHTERIDKISEKPCIVMYNHVSDYDALVTICASPINNRYVMSDRLIRKFPMRILLKLLTDGMYRTKGKNADNIKQSCIMTVKKGINVFMSPEGEESVDGCSHPVRGGTGQLVKDMDCAMVTYRITGTYFSKPPYAKNKAKGPKFGEVVKVYTREELSKMSPEEINDAISRDIYVNHYDWIKEKKIRYVRERPAEHLESVLYICPSCRCDGGLSSDDDVLKCGKCGYEVKVNDYGLFEGEKTIFDNLRDWYAWQEKEFASLMEKAAADGRPIATSSGMKLFVKKGEKAEQIDSNVTITVTTDEIIIRGDIVDKRYPIGEIISVTVPSTNGINVFVKEGYYVLEGKKSDCTKRYRILFKLIKKYRSEH